MGSGSSIKEVVLLALITAAETLLKFARRPVD